MVKYIDDLVTQICTTPFRRMLFTIYEHVDEEGYIKTVAKNCTIDDLEFIKLDIGDDVDAIKAKDNYVLNKYKKFKRFIENKIQDTPYLSIFIISDLGMVIAVKPKTLDLNTINFQTDEE